MAEVPSVIKYIQEEEVDFRSPMSESMLQKLGGSINYLLNNAQQFAVGEVVEAMVDETTFQSQMGTSWILCDGRDVTGSRYAAITGINNIPDARGMFLRSQNLNRNDGLGNPAGNQPLGTLEMDENVTHGHNATVTNASPNQSGKPTTLGKTNGLAANAAGAGIGNIFPGPATITGSITPVGTEEMRPNAVTINIFIKIN